MKQSLKKTNSIVKKSSNISSKSIKSIKRTIKSSQKSLKEDSIRIILWTWDERKHWLINDSSEVQLKVGMLANRIIQNQQNNDLECIWGSKKCISKFLANNGLKYLNILNEYHTFVDRNYLLFYAWINPEVTIEDWEILDKYWLLTTLMTSKVPLWLEKWTVLILKYLEFEQQYIKQKIQQEKQSLNENDVNKEWEIILYTRISHVALTLDKVKHSLISMNITDPPLRKLTYREIFYNFWEHKISFKFSLFNVLEKLESSELKEQWLTEFWKITEITLTPEMNDDEWRKQFIEMLSIISSISIKVRQIKSNWVYTDALADFLYLYSRTYTYFTPSESYTKFHSQEVWIKKWESHNKNIRKRKRKDSHPKKQDNMNIAKKQEFDPNYIWGQLWWWFRHSFEKPYSLISSERKLALNYPELDSFVINKTKNMTRSSKIKYFEESISKNRNVLSDKASKCTHKWVQNQQWDEVKSINSKDPELVYHNNLHREYYTKEINKREDFLKQWSNNFSLYSDPSWTWNFKSKYKMYGSVQLESLLNSGLEFSNCRLEYFIKTIQNLI